MRTLKDRRKIKPLISAHSMQFMVTVVNKVEKCYFLLAGRIMDNFMDF